MGLAGFLTFRMGLIQAFFHCRGTTDAARDKLKSLVIGLLKIGAIRRKQQAGTWPRPVHV